MLGAYVRMASTKIHPRNYAPTAFFNVLLVKSKTLAWLAKVIELILLYASAPMATLMIKQMRLANPALLNVQPALSDLITAWPAQESIELTLLSAIVQKVNI